MKSFILILKLTLIFNVCYSQTNNSIHCLGNGDYGVYEEGINMIQVFGPPYSSPSLFRATLRSPDIHVETKREQGTDIYVHTLYKSGKIIGTITDFVCSRLACFCRLSDLTEPVSFSFSVNDMENRVSIAQAIGIPGIFHRHENDEVEITGYLLIQAFDYFEKTKNNEFINLIMPFLEWCWEVQKKNLVDNMLPFNGDETYIAGGMVSRKVLNDGSSEATLLFIEGGRRFLAYAEHTNFKKRQWLFQNSEILDKVAEHYRDNFIKDGRLLVNNPKRAELCTFPEYRYGVCLYPGHGGYQGILKHFNGSLYFCKACYGKAGIQPEPEVPEEFFLPSVYLMPIYIGSTLFSVQEKENMLKELVSLYQKSGQITLNQHDKRLLGYDYGLFLYALT